MTILKDYKDLLTLNVRKLGLIFLKLNLPLKNNSFLKLLPKTFNVELKKLYKVEERVAS